MSASIFLSRHHKVDLIRLFQEVSSDVCDRNSFYRIEYLAHTYGFVQMHDVVHWAVVKNVFDLFWHPTMDCECVAFFCRNTALWKFICSTL